MKKLSDYKGQNVAVNCTTPEQAEAFCKLMHENGLKWYSGKSYLEKTNWENYKENTCYYFKLGEFGNIEFYQRMGYPILPATDFLEEEFVYGQEYEFYSNNTNRFKEKYLCKTPDGKFVSYDGATISLWDYCRKINTERSEAITTAKELITKFDIKQEEIY